MRKNRYSTLIIASAVFLLFLTGSLLYVSVIRNQNERQSLNYLRDATGQRNMAVSRQIEGDFQVLRGLSSAFSEMDLNNEQQILSILDRSNRSNVFFRMGLADVHGSAYFIDLDGSVQAGVDMKGQGFYDAALRGSEVISPTFYHPYVQGYVNYYAVPVYQDGSVVRVLMGVNHAWVYQEILDVPVFQGQGYFALMDSDGNIVSPVTDPNPKVETDANMYDIVTFSGDERENITHALANKGAGNFSFTLDGVRELVTLQPTGINDWFMISVVPRDAINTYYNQTVVGTTIIVMMACLIFLFLMYYQMRTMNKNQQALETLAYSDPLTGARNYSKFLIDAKEYIQEHPGRKMAVWSFDIKKFASINDLYGYAVGDQLLKMFAEKFHDQIFCRISADQFAGLRPYSSKSEMISWFDSLRYEFQSSPPVSTQKIRLDYCMGFYSLEDFAGDIVLDMFNGAAAARKIAKDKPGSVALFYTREMSEHARRESQLENEGRSALERGEFTFFLQPKVNIQDNFRIAGAEVLVRWEHGTQGLISPGEFIPLFEHNGFIVQLDRYIFEKACQWYRDCLDNGRPKIWMSVNVSRQGLFRDDFIEYYTSVKEKYGIGDFDIELEFTESMILEDYQLFHQRVLEVKKQGFMCSIDDFGSGYSSLNVLKNLPIDVLKLDSLFFMDSEDRQRERIVVSSFINMARRLQVQTVAEGVEQREQVEYLQEMGCDLVQGYYFSKPLPRRAFLEMIDENGGHFSLDE